MLRHVAWQDAGLLRPALERRGYQVVYVDVLLAGGPNPLAAEADVLIVLGGPNGAYDESAYPRLAHEMQLIEQRLAVGRPMLGICLGAQLIARALGAQVRPMGYPEIGLGRLELTDDGERSLLRGRAESPVLFWHQDTFDLPARAVLLARSELCANQAFAYGANTLGLQFHLELDPARFEEWLVGNAHQLAHLGVDPVRLRSDMRQHADAFSAAGSAFVDDWLDRVEDGLGLLDQPGASPAPGVTRAEQRRPRRLNALRPSVSSS